MNKKVLGFASVILLVIGAFYLVQAQSTTQDASSALPHLTSAQYARASADDVFVMLIGMETCRPCRMAEKLAFLPLAERYKNAQHVHVVKVDMSEAKMFNVTVSPTMLVICGGETEPEWRWLDADGKDRGFARGEEDEIIKQIAAVVDSLK